MAGRTPESRVVIVGSSFAGLTAAFELRRRLSEGTEIVVVDRREHFTFIPSLIWVPFGGREPGEITFPLAPTYEERGIRFVHDTAESVDTDWRQVVLSHHGHLSYDRLLVATGPHLDFERIPGLGPDAGYTESICTLEHALRTRSSWKRLMADPGPVVVGVAQGAGYFHPSYEYVLNAAQRMRAAGITSPVSFVTAEPFLGHFGLDRAGRARRAIETTFARLDIEALPGQAITEVRDSDLELESGRVLPFAHAMIIPPLRGVDLVRASLGLGNEMGWVPVDDHYRHVRFPEVFAAGVVVAIEPGFPVSMPVAKTGYVSQNMARIAARNIAADLGEGTHQRRPTAGLGALALVDGGEAGVFVRSDDARGEAENAYMIQGPQTHWAKVAFERFFLATRKRGVVRGQRNALARGGVQVEPTILLVLGAATATALATGLGALPLAFGRPGRRSLSDGNAVAAGVMLAAALALAREGVDASPTRALAGAAVGAVGIIAVRRLVPTPSRLGGERLAGEDARRIVVILVVMTAHSAAEGIGVGVSFGEGATFGWGIAIAIAVHNIPEGLAISLVLVPRGVGVSRAAGWSILSSAPQPILAVPAFAFVVAFLPILPVGLGLAAGAMAWMVLAELGPEALRGAPAWRVGALGIGSFVAMTLFQAALLGA